MKKDQYCLLGVRDYIHVVDLAKGHLAAFSALDSKGFQTFNLGTGKGTSVFEMVSAFRKASEQLIPTMNYERRAGDVAWMWKRFSIYSQKVFNFYLSKTVFHSKDFESL